MAETHTITPDTKINDTLGWLRDRDQLAYYMTSEIGEGRMKITIFFGKRDKVVGEWKAAQVGDTLTHEDDGSIHVS